MKIKSVAQGDSAGRWPRCMNNSFIVKLLILALAIFCGISHSVSLGDDRFVNDLSEAQGQAREESKNIVILFTGVKWCPPCQKLEEEVFSDDGLVRQLKELFVLLKLDFNKDGTLVRGNDENVIALMDDLGVTGFPTIAVTNADLTPFRFMGYENGGAEHYEELFAQAKEDVAKIDEWFRKADRLSGKEKAETLDKALSLLGENHSELFFSDKIEQIALADPKNEFGFREKWNGEADALLRKLLITELVTVAKLQRPQEAIKAIDASMNSVNFTDSERLTLMQLKLSIAKEEGQDEFVEVLDQMIGMEGVEGTTRYRLINKKAFLLVGVGKADQSLALLDDEIKKSPRAGYLYLGKGQVLASKQQFDEAIKAYDIGLDQFIQPDLAIELVAARADALFFLKRTDEAVKSLEEFAQRESFPADLRSEALIQQAIYLRQLGEPRKARLTENRAFELIKRKKDRASFEKLVERLHEYEFFTTTETDVLP